MKKHILFSIFSLVFFSLGYPLNPTYEPLSLSSTLSKHFFNFETSEEKAALNEQLISGKIPSSHLQFKGVVLEDLDLSGMHLRDIDFSGCIFKRVNFKDADLTGTKFDEAIFENVDLNGAIVYAPLGPDKKANLEKAFRIKDQKDHYSLLKQYSDRMLKVRAKNYDQNDEEVKLWLEEAEGLNKFFPLLKLNLGFEQLQGFDLTNLSYAELYNSYLQGTWLSKEIQLPLNYSEDNKTDLFKKLLSDKPEELSAYQKLFHFAFNMIKEVDPNLVRRTLEEKVKLNISLYNCYLRDVELQGAQLQNAQLQNAHLGRAYLQGAHLQNVNLEYANLQGAHLENVQLQNANLYHANLQNANLQNTSLQNADLDDAQLENVQLQGAWLSEKVQVFLDYTDDNKTKLFKKWANGNPDEQKEYQKLFNNQFNMIKGVDSNLLRETLERKVKSNTSLHNSYLKDAQLQGLQLQNAQLQNAQLQNAQLQNANLSWAQLKEAQLQGAHLENTKLRDANLQNAQLQGAWLSENVQVPLDYTDDNKTKLFEKWAYGNPGEQKAYQKLFNSRFNMIQGVDPNLLRQTLEKKGKSNTLLYTCNLEYAQLQGVHLQDINLYEAQLQGAHLQNAQLQNANLMNANLQGAHLQNANLIGSQLEGTYLKNAQLQGAHLENACLSYANLQGAHLENAQLQNAYLMNANLQGAHLENANLKDASLDYSNLKDASLDYSNLQGAHLENANLKGTSLCWAHLSPFYLIRYYDSEEKLIGFYHSCPDQEAKKLFKNILIAMKIIIEN